MRRPVWLSLLALALALAAALTTRPTGAQAVTLDFESGRDGAPIGATIPGVQFSNSAGADWTYGDVRSGRYNAPYPQSCPDFGGSCAYAVSGSVFAWMGEAAGVGRIDFVGSTATRFGAGFSTADLLTVSAYAADGQILATQTVAPNLRTGRLDRVDLRAPVGSNIAYVLISGGQNRWLMDDLTTDARVTPPPPPPTITPAPEARPANPALVTVVQRPTPNITVAAGNVLTLVVEAANRGRGSARDTLITLPYDPAVVTVLDARFSRPGAWVSRILANSVEIRTGPLGAGGDIVSATLRLRVSPQAEPGANLGARLSFSWSDGAGGGTGRSNFLTTLVGDRDLGAESLPLGIMPASDGRLRYTSVALAPFEPVGVWYTTPAGATIAVTTLRADANGVIDASFDGEGLPTGTYTLVVSGQWSRLTCAGPFTIAGDGGS